MMDEFARNNIEATRRVADVIAANGSTYVVNISSSVVNSMAVDWLHGDERRHKNSCCGKRAFRRSCSPNSHVWLV